MEKFSRWILNHKIWIISIFILLIALSVVGVFFVHKQGDVLAYLQDDTDTIIGKKVLESEYDIIGDSSIAISYLNRDQVEKIIKTVSNDPKVSPYLSRTAWLGSFDEVKNIPGITPEQLQQTNETAKAKFVKTTTDAHGNEVTTHIVSMYFNTPGSDDRTIKALDQMDKVFSDEISKLIEAKQLPDYITSSSDVYYIGGTAQNARQLISTSLGDMPKFIIVAVIAILIILLVTTRSYIEPLIFLATLGISLLLNMGSNVIAGTPVIGTISSITSSCAVILQLAIAMDYSIFLMHSYYEEVKITLDPKEALIRALPKTLKAISASALTTVGGFVALFFMKYRMGYDLGFVLAKGVILSLISVIFLQPIFILVLNKVVKKTSHKWEVEVKLRPVAKHLTKNWLAIVVTVVCIAVAIPCAYFQTKAPLNYITMTEENPNPTLPESVTKAIDNQLIIMVPFKNDTAGIEKQYTFIEELKKVGIDDPTTSEVTEVFSLFTIIDKDLSLAIEKKSPSAKSMIYAQLHSNFVSNIMKKDQNGQIVANQDPDAHHYMLYTVNLEKTPEDESTYVALNKIRTLANDTFGDVKITGLAQGAYELSKVTPNDFALVNIISAVIIFLILFLTFKKPMLSLLLLLVIETGIFINLTIVFLIGTKINFMAYLIVSAIELGATVDYAILITSKYLEERAEGKSSKAAIKNAIYRGAPSVLTSGAILIAVCLCVRLVTSNMIVSQITELIARGAFMSLVLVFTLLPSLLIIRDNILRAIRIKRGKGDPEEGKDETALCDEPFDYIWTRISKKRKLALAVKNGVVSEDVKPTEQDITIDASNTQNETVVGGGIIIDNPLDDMSTTADKTDNDTANEPKND